jgi:hypothetical protein
VSVAEGNEMLLVRWTDLYEAKLCRGITHGYLAIMRTGTRDGVGI